MKKKWTDKVYLCPHKHEACILEFSSVLHQTGNRFKPQTAVQNNYAVWSRGAGRGKCYTLGLAASLCIISRDMASDGEGCKGTEEKSLLVRQTSG